MSAIDPGCGETKFPDICGVCGENMRWVGKTRDRRQVCGCPETVKPKAKPRINTARKGKRLEVAERKKLEGLGVRRAVSQPGSGAYGTRNDITFLQGDNAFQIAGLQLRQECKSRADDSGWKIIKEWMQGCEVLTIKQDRQPPIHVLTDETWRHLVGAANSRGEGE